MSIVSFQFLLFMAVVVGVYYILSSRFQWIWLLCASIFFYVYYNPRLSLWLFLSALSIYIGGRLIERFDVVLKDELNNALKENRKKIKNYYKKIKSSIVVMITLFNGGLWVLFKFGNMIAETLEKWSNSSFSLPEVLIPLGISFYTLQAISYVSDVKRGKCGAQKNFAKLALWLTFFPQIIQGPISRYSDTAEQLFIGHKFNYQAVTYGAQLILWGYFKKVVIADHAAVIVASVFGDSGAEFEGMVFLVGIVMYAIQIYGDFSGGIDIISGFSEMLGIHLPENFRRPYFSRSIPEYWRRWHITLGTWFRDYIFYPLSISKTANGIGKRTRKWFGSGIGKMIPTYMALGIVWTSNGIWHGAGMQFALYGFYNGILTILGMQFGEGMGKFAENKLHLKQDTHFWKGFQILRTFALVCWGRVLFKAGSVTAAMGIYKSMLTTFNPKIFLDGTLLNLGLDFKDWMVLLASIMVLFVMSCLQESGISVRKKLAEQNIFCRWAVYYAAIFIIVIFGAYGTGYDAGGFIYMKF